MLSVVRVARVGEAHASAIQAHELAALCGEPGEPHALQALAWTSVMRGLPLDDLIALPADRDAGELSEASIERQMGVRHMFRGELGEARAAFRMLHAAAEERGESRYRAVIQLQLCEVELRAGRVMECTRLLDQQHEWVALDDVEANWARCQALCAAIAGQPEQAERWAAAVADVASAAPGAADTRWDELEAQRAQGIAALLAQRPDRASQVLGQVWEYTRREGVTDPGAFPVAPDLVEALTRTGAITEAIAVAERLRDLATSQHHPWGLATADRCRATVALASRYDEQAAVMAAAAAALGELGLGFDRARSLLWLGQMARRARKRAFARSFLKPRPVHSTSWAPTAGPRWRARSAPAWEPAVQRALAS